MPKSQYISPENVFVKDEVKFLNIKSLEYNKRMKDLKDDFSNQDLINMYRDMYYIRKFEEMLIQIRMEQNFEGINYIYNGPAHSSIGQEPTAVGQAFVLDTNDFTFGSHRSHGEILARGLRAIEILDDNELLNIMNSYFDGEIYNITKDNSKSIKEQAKDFFFYGLIAELFGRITGFQRGLGNSMHEFFTPFGIYPNNAIVGGAAPMAVGAALYKRVKNKKGITIANIGDGSLGSGPVWESMILSAMDQYNTLWDEKHRGGLPILFNILNNQYAMGGQPNGETMAYKQPVRVAAGVNPEMMNAERIDGFNIFAVIDATKRAKDLLEGRKGPVLLEVLTYRYEGHSQSDANTYRTEEEINEWKTIDPVIAYREDLKINGIADEEKLVLIENEVIERLKSAIKLSIDDEISPRMDFKKDVDAVAKYMFSNQYLPKCDDDEADVLIPYSENPQVKRLEKKSRFAYDDKGREISSLKTLTVRDAIFEAMLHRMYEDSAMIAFGEEHRDWGGSFGVYRGITESMPYHRFFNTPISESALVGAAVGYAISGGRAVTEMMYCDFLGRAGDEIFNQMAKWQSMSAGTLRMPVVLRLSIGTKYGAQHSQDWSSLVAHIPGLKVVFPATPYDAKGLMNTALAGSDPVIFVESQRIYDTGEKFHEGGVPSEYYEIPIGEPDIKRVGSDLTILSIGATLYRADEAVSELKEKYGISAELIDARSVVPFNYEKVIESVKKTGKIILVSDAVERGNILQTMASKINEFAFDYLDAPVIVLGAHNVITPCYELEKDVFPQAKWIIDAVDEHIIKLKGNQKEFNFSSIERMRKERLGI